MVNEIESPRPPLDRSPVVDQQRIESLDVLRGFALGGVLVMNMQAFADTFAVYMHPFALGDLATIDYACWVFNRVVADSKFITIFSMLFGAGIALMTSRAVERTGRSAGIHYRRMFWLMIFGMAHVVLLWARDILFIYGVVGLAAYLCRRWYPWVQVTVAAFFLLITATIFSLLSFIPEADLDSMRDIWEPSERYVAANYEAIRGGLREQIEFRVKDWGSSLGFIVVYGWRVLACMLLGMAMYTRGVLAAERSRRFYGTMITVGLGVGLPLAAWGVYDHEIHDWDLGRCFGIGSMFNYVGSVFAAFGWIGVVMLVCRERIWFGVRCRFAAMGQMALTNYIMHSVICTTIYNGHGLGLFGQVDRIWQQLLSLAIIALQLWYSPLWLERFRFGPLEWLWRSLTYWRWQPFRREA